MGLMYRIQRRKWSSNILERGVRYKTSKGEDKINWEPYIAPLVSKIEGDIICDKLIKQLC